MTAQISDVFLFRGRSFDLAGISEGELFDPALLELRPQGLCTACWRGYQAVFSLLDSRLVVDELHLNLEDPPRINGVAATGPRAEFDWFRCHYSGLAYHLEYSGGLLLADGFIEELYVHMGFHPAWKYETVIELVFHGGVIQHEYDRSGRMMEVRQHFLESRNDDSRKNLSKDEIREFVERSFDRSYDL